MEALSVVGLTDKKLKDLLARQSKAQLVDWIVDQATDNVELRSAVVELVAPQADVKTLTSELRQTITRAWSRVRSSREPWKLAPAIEAELSPLLPRLDQMIDGGHAVEAEKVLRRFVEAADKGFDHVDDSYGLLWPMCQDAVALWGKAWAKIDGRDPIELSKFVFDQVQSENHATRDQMIQDFSPALGRAGLLALRGLLEAEYEARQADPELDGWRLREPLRHLAEVADALGDVEMFIDVQRRAGAEDVYALPIARRLLEADRAAEALAYLDRTDADRPTFRGEADDAVTLRCKILRALGRDVEARDVLWQDFQNCLSQSSLDQALAMTPEDQRNKVLDEALALAEEHRSKLTAAEFLVDRGQDGRAARLIVANPDAFDGRYYSTLRPLAELLDSQHPAAAWVLYRALLLDILESKRSKAYHHAADYLATMRRLALSAGLDNDQQALLAHLREKHGRKYAFWNLVKKQMGG